MDVRLAKERLLLDPESRAQLILLAMFSWGLAAASFYVQSNIGFAIADEGFLWYGAQRVLLGEVPLRDFMAYDPGRYYWSAFFMWLTGSNGVVSLRVGLAVVQGLGLFLALSTLARAWKGCGIAWLLPASVILMLWMYPRHKMFDITASICLIAALTYLIEKPSSRRYFVTGLVVGLIAVFGRNHGLYGSVASLAAVCYLMVSGKGERKLIASLAWLAAGVVTGYLPLLLGLIFVPGLADAVWKSILFILEIGSTNLPRPVPWPWTSRAFSPWFLIGIFYILMPLFGLGGIAYALYARISKKKLPPAAIACIFLTLPYAHHAFSRAGLTHLAQGIFPFLIGAMTIFSKRSALLRITVVALLLSSTLAIMLPMQPKRQALRHNWQSVQIGRDLVQIDPVTADILRVFDIYAKRYLPEHGTFFAAPFWPGIYAVYGRKSPVWEIYPLFPRNAAFQEAEIQRIESAAPEFAIIQDLPLDKRDELRFRNTHPLIDQYLRQNYERVNGLPAPQDWQVYRNKEAELEKSGNCPVQLHPMEGLL